MEQTINWYEDHFTWVLKLVATPKGIITKYWIVEDGLFKKWISTASELIGQRMVEYRPLLFSTKRQWVIAISSQLIEDDMK